MTGVRARIAGGEGGLAAMVVATVAFSTGFPIVKGVDLGAAPLAMWRLGLGVAVLAMVALAARSPWPRRMGPVVVTGVSFAIHQLIFIEATKLTAIAVVTLVAAMQPLLVSLVSRRTVGEPVPLGLLGWSAAALTGTVLVLVATTGDASRDLVGDVLAVLNLLAFTAYFLAAKRARTTGAPTLTFTASFLGVALIAILPFALAADQVAPPTAMDAGWIAILALLPGNGHLLLNWAHGRTSATLASIVLAGIPLLASLWGWLIFDEPFGLAHVIGIGLVAAAIIGGRRVELRQPRATPAPPAGESGPGSWT